MNKLFTATLFLLLLFGTTSLNAQTKNLGEQYLPNGMESTCDVGGVTAYCPENAKFSFKAELIDMHAVGDKVELYVKISSSVVNRGEYKIGGGRGSGAWEGNFSYGIGINSEVYYKSSYLQAGNVSMSNCSFSGTCPSGNYNLTLVLSKNIVSGLGVATKTLSLDNSLKQQVWANISFSRVEIASFKFGSLGNDGACYEKHIIEYKKQKQQQKSSSNNSSSSSYSSNSNYNSSSSSYGNSQQSTYGKASVNDNSYSNKGTISNSKSSSSSYSSGSSSSSYSSQSKPKPNPSSNYNPMTSYYQTQNNIKNMDKISNNALTGLDNATKMWQNNIAQQAAKQKAKDDEDERQRQAKEDADERQRQYEEDERKRKKEEREEEERIAHEAFMQKKNYYKNKSEEAHNKLIQQFAINHKYNRKTDDAKWFVIVFDKSHSNYIESSIYIDQHYLSFTKPFQIFAYDDGTMPFEKDILNDATKKVGVTYQCYLLGAYNSKEEAEQTINTLPVYLQHEYIQCTAGQINYSRSSKGNTKGDFWENGNKTPTTTTPQTKTETETTPKAANNSNFWDD